MPELFNEYLRDESFYSGSCALYRSVSSADEIAALLHEDLPLTVQGARTGIVGAAVPEGGCVCDISAFTGIETLGKSGDTFCLDVLPGTTLDDLTTATERKPGFTDCFFAPDPTERGATLGGLCATNAGGPSSLLYGHIADHVIEADIRLADGVRLTLKKGDCVFDENGTVRLPCGRLIRVPFSRSLPGIASMDIREGRDLLDVFLGSEGMLGIFERIRLGLIKKPAVKWSVIFFFDDAKMCGMFADAVCDCVQSWGGGDLSALEYLDVASLKLYADYRARASGPRTTPEPPRGLCAIMAEVIAESEAYAYSLLEDLLKIARDSGCGDEDSWAANDPVGLNRFRLLRHGIPESVNARIGRNRRRFGTVTKSAADITLPSLSRADALERIHGLLDSEELAYAVFGHIGSKGYHINLLPENEAQSEKAKALYDALMKTALSAGGLIVAENGVGKLKRDIMKYLSKDRIDTISAVKRQFDPHGKLNPGNMIRFSGY
jgi:FAD/FMN-containing dehydrogenase